VSETNRAMGNEDSKAASTRSLAALVSTWSTLTAEGPCVDARLRVATTGAFAQ